MATKPAATLRRLLILLLMIPPVLVAQPRKVGVVLSGGGSRGLAHIGVLKVLEEAGIPIDIVTGTSFGAIVGGLYASGYSAAQLERIALGTDWDRLFTDHPNRRYIPIVQKSEDAKYMLSFPLNGTQVGLPGGMVGGHEAIKYLSRLTAHVHHITDFQQLPIAFACVATDLETGEAWVIRSGNLAEAIRASLTLPSIFEPMQVGNRRALDGGIARNLPVVDAIDLGADFIIAVDVSSDIVPADSINGIFDVLNQTVSYQILRTTAAQRELADVLLLPQLGYTGMMDFDRAEAIIAQGEASARAILPRLQALAAQLRRERGTATPRDSIPLVSGPYRITGIDFQGAQTTDTRTLESELRVQLPLGEAATLHDLDLAADRLYSLEFFQSVRYELVPDSAGGYRVVFGLKERVQDRLRVGLRYDTRDRAALLFNATYRNLWQPSSTLRASVRLGDQTGFDAQYFAYVGGRDKLGYSTRVGYERRENDLYAGNRAAATLTTDAFLLEGWVGPLLTSTLLSGVGFREEITDSRVVSGSFTGAGRRQVLHNPFAFLIIDTADDAYYPTTGTQLNLRSDMVNPFSDAPFSRHQGTWRNFIPINEQLTLHLNLSAYHSIGTVPVGRRLFWGDYPEVVGFTPDRFSGASMRLIQLGAQIRMAPDQFLTLKGNLISEHAIWETDLTRFPLERGFGAAFGTRTILGPAEVVLMGNSTDRAPIVYLSIGYRF